MTNCRSISDARNPRDHATAYLLLLHELGVGAVVDDILAEHRGGERVVDLLSVDVLQLAIEDEVVALGAQADGGLLAEKNEGEDIAVLLTAGEEEGVGVHAVGDGVADPWQQVEDDRRLVGVAEEDLLEDVQEDGEGEQTAGGGEHDEPGGSGVEERSQRASEALEETHGSERAEGARGVRGSVASPGGTGRGM